MTSEDLASDCLAAGSAGADGFLLEDMFCCCHSLGERFKTGVTAESTSTDDEWPTDIKTNSMNVRTCKKATNEDDTM